ncbi:hypothetical protein LQD23_16340 [Chromobacterium violaceum]|uniref:hypothetical protein n=1 Tax=Chromobacterium violaceum TaxID=536 RepID=UPI001E388272|nr:hypothetical protein [Chromobacterium violaceum]MCD0493851.1 hypothetical protein [Chromobacterium violaceum]
MKSHGQNFSSQQNISQAMRAMFSCAFISPSAKTSYHPSMDIDIYEIRRQNLETLLRPRGAAARIAGKTGSSASYLSTVKTSDRRLGDDLARRIEEAEGLPHGWLDQLHVKEVRPAELARGITSEELAIQIGELDTDEMHKVIAQALEHHTKKKAP